jgi:dienelactone hydrolase
MSFRNLSPQQMFEQMAREHRPLFAFENGADWPAWKAHALPQVMATLGDFPPPVAPNPLLLAEWHHDGLRKQRWLIDVGPHISATVLVNYPPDFDPQSGDKRAAILCWHGHGPSGKEPVMGNDSSSALREQIAAHNYNYGHQMAHAGFITFALDWIGGGERNDSQKPNWRAQNSGGERDWCNLLYLHATMLGMTSLSINLAHGRAATDFVASLPGVDGARLGVMGLSGGGTMALWTALYDERFSAAEIICYSDLWPLFGMRDCNYCGMQVAPGLFKLVSLGDLQGLLAPLPLLIDIGVYDSCFKVDGALQCFAQVERIYGAAGARQRLELDLFPGEHGWGGHQSARFFQKHLSR